MGPNLFRRQAIARSASAERLDERIRIVTVPRWAGLLAGVLLAASLLVWSMLATVRTEVSGQALLVHTPHVFTVEAPVYGVITSAPPKVGSTVAEGQEITQIRRTDLPGSPLWKVTAPVSGTVVSVVVDRGSTVSKGDNVAAIDISSTIVVQAFIPTDDGKLVSPGMSAQVSPTVAPSATYGLMKARVSEISRYSMTDDAIRATTGNQNLAATIINGPPVLLVTLELLRTPSGAYVWTSGSGPPFSIESGTLATAMITISQSHPIDLIFNQGG